MGSDKALWAADHMHMDLNGQSNVFNTMHNAFATYFDYQKGRFGLVTQVGYGNGTTAKGDLLGLPDHADLLHHPEKLEVIVTRRYRLRIVPQVTTLGRQVVSNVGKFTGDTYNSAYVGLNYYVYGQKAKLMVGGQYDELTGGTGKNAN